MYTRMYTHMHTYTHIHTHTHTIDYPHTRAEGEEHDTLDEDDDRGERADSGPQGEESASVLGLASPRFSVVSGPFEGPTTYEPDDEDISVLSEHEQAFEDVITSILKNMKQHKDKADVHRYGTLALENLASRSGSVFACACSRVHVRVCMFTFV